MRKKQIKCYVINLDRSQDRLNTFLESFEKTKLEICRVRAVDGSKLQHPCPEVSELKYRLFHGQRISNSQIGCSMSHLLAMQTFLATNDENALICEDDVSTDCDLSELLDDCLSYRKSWDLIRLNGLRHYQFCLPYATVGEYQLARFLGWFSGAGAYVVNRRAAEILLKRAYPIFLPFDHFLAKSHYFGIKTAAVEPYPIRLNTFSQSSTIAFAKYPKLLRWPTVLPYRGVVELRKWLYQLREIAITRAFPPKPE